MLSDKILNYASTLKVLYVEDHEETRNAMMMILEDTFAEVRVAVNGQDGLDSFKKEEGFSLIISDINMPKLNGIDMLKAIRQIDSKVPILILSAHSDPSYFMDTIHLGIEGYLLKPIEIDQFDYMIEKTVSKLVIEAEREHYEKELQRTNIELLAATKAKDEFLANMSHEIRTPMNAIIGLSYILLKGDLGKKQSEYVDKIHTSGNLLLGIINDILDFSKIEAGKLDIECIDFNLNTVLSNVSNIVSAKAKEKDLELIFDIDSKLPMMFRGDPIRLGQVIINLMNNAVKFTEIGEVSLKVTPTQMSEEKEILKFEVIDSGIGMTAEHLERLFESFTQADSSTSRKYGGTGLGLTISKQLVELMGGSISVESKHGVGSRFTFSIEFEVIHNREQRKFRLPSHTLMNKKVLIINANVRTSRVLSEMLDYFRYKSLTASSIESAQLLVENNSFDIIFIEREILVHTYSELLRQYKDTKIVILESSLHYEDNEYYNGIAIDGHLEKPFNQEMIFNSILDLFTTEGSKKQYDTLESTNDEFGVIRGTTLLLAEDNTINQAVIMGLLENTGINIIIANNGQEAIELIPKNPEIGLVLMDVNMPVMGGYEATKIIREELKYSSLPIVALTANAMQSDIINAKKAGMQDHLAKPIDVSEFKNLLLKYLAPDEQNTQNVEKKIADDIDVIHSLSILDVADGIERMGGNEKLYRKVLHDFLEKFKDISFELGATYKLKDFEKGVALTHDLKGVSGTIGAQKLHKVSESLELAFRSQDIDSRLIFELAGSFKALKVEIESYLESFVL